MNGSPSFTVRHYCQGIGDCHLLSFRDGDEMRWMLIDCGIHPSATDGTARMRRVVEDILTLTRRIDVLVVTHEHMDHVSGFVTCADLFAQIHVEEVWLPWTEDPDDDQAKELDRYRGQAFDALSMTSQRLFHLNGDGEEALRLNGLVDLVFGAKGDRVREARNAAVRLGRKVRYLEPGDPPIAIVPGIRAFPLGPPRDAKLLGLTDKAGETFGFEAGWPALHALIGDGQGGFDDAAPFAPDVGGDLDKDDEAKDGRALATVRDIYFAGRRKNEADASWRRIDGDWLSIAADLALQLDERTNNTSLVLAFEMQGSPRRVVLFPGDAQIGSWMSWPGLGWTLDGGVRVTGAELLEGCVYLKVSHHGSHNATQRAGLAMMASPDLSAFIPTNAEDAKKVRWHRMPLEAIVAELTRKCAGRLLRADDDWANPLIAPGGALVSVRRSQVPNLWVEVELR